MKIGIVGVGRVGSQIAMLALMRFRPERMVLIDKKDLSGDVRDLEDACSGLGIATGFSTQWEPADVYIVCAGRARDEKTRSMAALWKENRKILDAVLPKLAQYAAKTVIVTNPSDTAYAYLKEHGINVYSSEHMLRKMRRGRKSGWSIVRTKGYTNFGPAVAVVKLLEQIL